MEIFHLNEFVYGLHLNDIKNDNTRNNVIKKILAALDSICPGSYMPFFFIAASGNNSLFLKPTDNKEEDSIPFAQTISSTDFAPYLSEESSIFNSCSGKEASNILYKGIKNILACINDAEHSSYCWYFDISIIWHWESMKSVDPLFTTFVNKPNKEANSVIKANKAAYFTLVSILNACMPVNPDYDDSYDDMSEEAFFSAKEEWLDFCDSLIMEFYCKRHSEYHEIPEGFCRIINSLLFDAQNHILYDPFNYYGQFALNINAHMSTPRELKTPAFYLYDEINDEIMLATEARMALRNCFSLTSERFRNLLQKIDTKSKDKKNEGSPKVDAKNIYFVTMPPFVKSIEINGKNVDPIVYSIEKGLSFVDQGGKMAIIVPSSVLISKKYDEIRMKLINDSHVVKFILMPSGSMDTMTGIATTILFADGSLKSDQVKFVDATNYFHKSPLYGNGRLAYNGNFDYIAISNLCHYDSFPIADGETEGLYIFNMHIWCPSEEQEGVLRRNEWDVEYYDGLSAESFKHDIKLVLKEEIRQNDYLLNPSFYFDHTTLVPEGYCVKKLSDILQEVEEIVPKPTIGKFISAKELHRNDFFSEIAEDKLPNIQDVSSYGLSKVIKISPKPTIIVSKLGSLVPTAITPTHTLYGNIQNIHSYLLTDENVDAVYLANEMRKDYFKNQLHYSKMVSGMWNELDLRHLSVFIPLPSSDRTSIDIQRETVSKESRNRLGSLGEQLIQSEEKRFNDYVMALRQRKHRLAQILNQVDPAFGLLNRTREKNKGILRDTDIVASRTGETVAQYFGKVQQGLDKIEHLLETFVDKNQWGKPKTFALEDFFEAFIAKHLCGNYKIVLVNSNTADELQYHIVNMPKDELSTVVENIIANAETWGFNDASRTDYVVRISLRDSEDQVLISIANNGTPIHPSVDRNHIFDWGVGTHTGVGTWQAKNIVEHYGGKICIDEHPDVEDGFQTEYLITLPREF